jgi:hypothetical protein
MKHLEPVTNNFREPEWHEFYNCPSCGSAFRKVIDYPSDGNRLVECLDCHATYHDIVK